MIKIYGKCTGCGIDGAIIRKVKRWAIANSEPIKLLSSRYDKDARDEHYAYLASLGLEKDINMSIIVTDGKPRLLKEWNI